MALVDSESPSLPGPRQSPGDAAFERLKQREALRAKDMPPTANTEPALLDTTLPSTNKPLVPLVAAPTAAEVAQTRSPAPGLAAEVADTRVSEAANADANTIVTRATMKPGADDAVVPSTLKATGVEAKSQCRRSTTRRQESWPSLPPLASR